MKAFAEKYWAWLLTALIILVALFVLIFSETLAEAAEIGEVLSGFSATLAFLWLIIGMRSQAADLALQRQELALQRSALERQAKELRNASKFDSLSRIEALLERSLEKIQEAGTAAKAPGEISTQLFIGMQDWKTILESKDPEIVNAKYQEWIKIESVAKRYLSSVATALKIYMEFHLDRTFEGNKPDDEFIAIYSTWMRNAPYLAEHEGNSVMIAEILFSMAPGLEALKVAGLFAIRKMAEGVNFRKAFKEGSLEAMRDELIQKKITIPAIAE